MSKPIAPMEMTSDHAAELIRQSDPEWYHLSFIIGSLAGLLARLTADSGSYQISDGPRLGTVLIDLLSALLAHTLDAENALAPEARRRVLTLRVRAFIEQHLHEPSLSASTIAAAHHISISYLHRLFQSESVTVGSLIRSQRLERVRGDLANPALRDIPIHRIGARWGFSDPAVLSRAFRAAYGIPPVNYRHRARVNLEGQRPETDAP
ncbi:helix-turn-helix domain-containing protein [Micromonospora sp. NBC_01699]|uniref:helix-turn-helix domain-containing protein n=1 Tax=Micromonospora sp. NBC_01699 TaxID=2975984 RepID=UPI002E2AD8C9|nr:helix-turn-helix domain-containing protein [Micromonospora sp. NBC_01699]